MLLQELANVTKFMKEIWQTRIFFIYVRNRGFQIVLCTNRRFSFSSPSCSQHLLRHVLWNAAGPRDGATRCEVGEILLIFSDWNWNQFMRTEPKSWGSSMSQHPGSQFLVGSSITGFCQVYCKFVISSLDTGFPLLPNGLIRFSSLRQNYCPQAKGKPFLFGSLPENKALCGLLQQMMIYENKRPSHSHVINTLHRSAAWGIPMADAHPTFPRVNYIPQSIIAPDFHRDSWAQAVIQQQLVRCISEGLPKVNCVLCSTCF